MTLLLYIGLSVLFLTGYQVDGIHVEHSANAESKSVDADLNTRLEGGTPTEQYTSLSLVVKSSTSSYYRLEYEADAVLFDPNCLVTDAHDFVDTSSGTPPVVNGERYYKAGFPRPGCDNFYRVKKIDLSFAYYNSTTKANDIAILKTVVPVELGPTHCKGKDIELAWISCDVEGPPANYTGCQVVSHGNIQKNQNRAPEDLVPNKVDVKILSKSACDAVKDQVSKAGILRTDPPFTPGEEICATRSDGVQPRCQYDENAVMYCKYWKQPEEGHGWRSPPPNMPPRASNNGWGWASPPKKQPMLAVGHYVAKYGEAECDNDQGAMLLVKYGSPTYAELFSKCNYFCSSNLLPGYRCKGSPPASLGPVYCIPEKIPVSTGWGSPSNGWSA